MKLGTCHFFGIAAIAVVLGSGPAIAVEAVGPYYATPSWDQTLPSNTRFIVLANFNSQAVLDRETGLVWQRSVNTIAEFSQGSSVCFGARTGGRFGWRVPTVDELSSLLDPTQSNPALPLGHPFQINVIDARFWTANLFEAQAGFAWEVNFATAGVTVTFPGTRRGIWCVRGGSAGSTPQ